MSRAIPDADRLPDADDLWDGLPDRLTDRLPDRFDDRLPDRQFGDGRTRLGEAGVAVAAVGLVALGGLPGVLFAAGLAVAWYLLPATYAFALGQVAVVALAPGVLGSAAFTSGPAGGLLGIAGFALAEIGLFALLLAPATTLTDPGPPVALAVAWALVGGALAWASAGVGASAEPWLAGLALVVLTALAAAVMHRYQLVSLGLVDDGGAPDEQ